jgi:hypothetical protein
MICTALIFSGLSWVLGAALSSAFTGVALLPAFVSWPYVLAGAGILLCMKCMDTCLIACLSTDGAAAQ